MTDEWPRENSFLENEQRSEHARRIKILYQKIMIVAPQLEENEYLTKENLLLLTDSIDNEKNEALREEKIKALENIFAKEHPASRIEERDTYFLEKFYPLAKHIKILNISQEEESQIEEALQQDQLTTFYKTLGEEKSRIFNQFLREAGTVYRKRGYKSITNSTS